MKRYLFILTLVCVVALFVGNCAADADGLIFMTAASFVATQHTDLGTPLGGLGFDPVAEKVEILARYTPTPLGLSPSLNLKVRRPLLAAL